MRRLPPRSVPVASQACPAARAAVEPPEEPPAVRETFQGLVVVPNSLLVHTAAASGQAIGAGAIRAETSRTGQCDALQALYLGMWGWGARKTREWGLHLAHTHLL